MGVVEILYIILYIVSFLLFLSIVDFTVAWFRFGTWLDRLEGDLWDVSP